MLKAVIFSAVAVSAIGLTPQAQAFSISFDWSGLKPCTTGRPNTVESPPFRIEDLPKGTQSVVFKLVDINVPRYNHGGGTIALTQSGKVAPGAFRYKSPCPPDGRHTYEWTATAKDGPRGRGKTLGIATARKAYP